MAEKRVKKFGQGPPPSQAMPERKRFLLKEMFPYKSYIFARNLFTTLLNMHNIRATKKW